MKTKSDYVKSLIFSVPPMKNSRIRRADYRPFLRLEQMSDDESDPAFAFLDSNNHLPTKEEWEEIKEIVDIFYLKFTSHQIDEFNQTPYNELNESSSEKGVTPGIIYILIASENRCKIGCTVNLKNRLKSYSTHSPYKAELLKAFEVSDMTSAEAWLHEKFRDKRLHGEWFNLENKDIEWLKNLPSLEELY